MDGRVDRGLPVTSGQPVAGRRSGSVPTRRGRSGSGRGPPRSQRPDRRISLAVMPNSAFRARLRCHPERPPDRLDLEPRIGQVRQAVSEHAVGEVVACALRDDVDQLGDDQRDDRVREVLLAAARVTRGAVVDLRGEGVEERPDDVAGAAVRPDRDRGPPREGVGVRPERRQRHRDDDDLPAERELATQLGVSRASVSQALVALEVQGVIDVRHGDGR
ncbi:GntR family transcriptional regulator [Pseudonocardia sp. T1-2H]|uniref:GntR family transcriptional regulator n=1 Tax=Pseudonocardia sp. T1-2H TaxID=3128899 RepID=UPI003100DABD